MITRIIFPNNVNCKASEDVGMRSRNIGSIAAGSEVYCLPGSFGNGYERLAEKPGNRLKKVDLGRNFHLKKKSDKPVILHVEDNAEIRFLVNVLLRKDFTVIGVETGEKALELVEKNKFDIILMDLNLGEGISGIDATRKIREEAGLEDIPIIAVTANNYHDVREDCIDAGMNAFIQKPFDKADLLQTIEELKNSQSG